MDYLQEWRESSKQVIFEEEEEGTGGMMKRRICIESVLACMNP